MSQQITLTEIAFMDTLIPDLRKLHLSIEAVELYIGNFACIVDEAYRMYDAAIDEEQPYPVRNDLYGHYKFAMDALNGWKARRDELKSELLAVQS
jgi:hypothetical protein